MMKAAFVCERNVDIVYNEELTKNIAELFDLYEGVYNRDNIREIKDVDCIFSTWGMVAFTEEEIKEFFPNLKIVFYGAGSVRAFAEPFLNLGVRVVSAWQANSVPVAEYTIAQIILANKGFYQCTRRYTSLEDRKNSINHFRTFPGNYDTKVGIIGLGAIGLGVVERLKAYHLDVCAYDPFCSQEKADKLGITLMSLEELFRECQVISNHVANIPETVGMMNYAHFSLMKDNGVFINTGRGAQVVESDLIRALKEKPERTAVLDVTHPEPPKEDSELYTMENIFLTPHVAGSAGNECFRMGEYMVEEAKRYLNSEALLYEVTLKMLETMA